MLDAGVPHPNPNPNPKPNPDPNPDPDPDPNPNPAPNPDPNPNPNPDPNPNPNPNPNQALGVLTAALETAEKTSAIEPLKLIARTREAWLVREALPAWIWDEPHEAAVETQDPR